jgi:HEPN domain-containing protein
MPNDSNNKLDWFRRAEHDLQDAKLLFQNMGHNDTIAVLIQQAIEKYLKGYLIGKGWKLKKTHDVELLLAEAAHYNQGLNKFLDFTRTITDFYIEERYPAGPPSEPPRQEIASYLQQAEELIILIKEEN